MCENLEALDEPEAKGSLIWIIGEYAERIDNADDLINIFLENFKEENPQVRLITVEFLCSISLNYFSIC